MIKYTRGHNMKIEDNELKKVVSKDIKDGVFEIPKNVTYIGMNAFSSLSELINITIPEIFEN